MRHGAYALSGRSCARPPEQLVERPSPDQRQPRKGRHEVRPLGHREGGVLHLIPERPSQPAPRDIELPTLDEKHWAWAAHYELGHGKSVSDNFARDCGWEANDDLGHIRYYLHLYKALAQDYSGSRLEAATWAPQFRGSYYTCMDICLKDLQLPSHFIALIHYGIAVQMVHIASSAPSALVVLDRLVDMYREDFAG